MQHIFLKLSLCFDIHENKIRPITIRPLWFIDYRITEFGRKRRIYSPCNPLVSITRRFFIMNSFTEYRCDPASRLNRSCSMPIRYYATRFPDRPDLLHFCADTIFSRGLLRRRITSPFFTIAPLFAEGVPPLFRLL